MQAVLRRLLLVDAADLEAYRPPDPRDFSLLVQIIAGPSDSAGEESFDLEVVTPLELARRAVRGPISGRHTLVVGEYDGPAIRRWIERTVASCSGHAWNDVALRLSRYALWEFEDYERSPGSGAGDLRHHRT